MTENAFIEAVKAYNDGAVFVAVDIETTGLDPKKDKIAEIGAVKFDKRGLIARFSTLINPGIPMPPEAGKVNNITDEMLKDMPRIDEVLPDFIAFVRNHILLAHNTPFDFGFINESLGPLSHLRNSTVDTLVLSRAVFPGKPSYSLQNLAAGLGIKSNTAHRAQDDAALCMEIFIRCTEAGFSG